MMPARIQQQSRLRLANASILYEKMAVCKIPYDGGVVMARNGLPLQVN
jgi:hypothetical protein